MSARPLVALLLGAALLAPTGAVRGQDLSPTEREIVDAVDARADEALAFLEAVVNVNSGTMNFEGVREVGGMFAGRLEEIGFVTRWVEMPDSVNRAGHLFATREGPPGAPVFLLIGHLDTVFEPGDAFQTFERDGERATGPGVVDMKGGDVAIVLALQALHEAGALADATVTVALIGDEESAGLPLSVARGELIEAAKAADVALGFEGGDPGSAVIARRASSAWTLEVTGRQGHSSRVFSETYGSGAIFEAARILHRFHEEVKGPEHLTFNPGVILGGTEVTYDGAENRGTAFGKTNVIAQKVVVDGGLRFISEEQKIEAREAMRAIVSEHLPGTSAEIEFLDKYPPMPPTEGNRALLEILDQTSEDLGIGPVEPYDPSARGAADISFVAPHVDGLDGLGVWGSGSHTPDEAIDLTSLPVVAKRAAVLIHRLTRELPAEVR
ncbi:MAG: M20/M25/M40 family metallo-hydrolase [Gemmatimonadota bacterium]|nr:M20/M25/M40 family metallo-hydrolase [Gemmatimonadota bacterium]